MIRKTPYRQFLAWKIRIREQWNKPDRHDHYIMYLISMVESIFGSGKRLDHYKIKFDTTPVLQHDLTKHSEDYAKTSQNLWMSAVGVRRKK